MAYLRCFICEFPSFYLFKMNIIYVRTLQMKHLRVYASVGDSCNAIALQLPSERWRISSKPFYSIFLYENGELYKILYSLQLTLEYLILT